MNALPRLDARDIEIDRALADAGGDARAAIRRLLERLDAETSYGYVRRRPQETSRSS